MKWASNTVRTCSGSDPPLHWELLTKENALTGSSFGVEQQRDHRAVSNWKLTRYHRCLESDCFGYLTYDLKIKENDMAILSTIVYLLPEQQASSLSSTRCQTVLFKG